MQQGKGEAHEEEYYDGYGNACGFDERRKKSLGFVKCIFFGQE